MYKSKVLYLFKIVKYSISIEKSPNNIYKSEQSPWAWNENILLKLEWDKDI